MAPMTTREDLRPTQKPLVMNILKSLGMDVSKWAVMKGGAARAASNPKYCYNWSFRQPGEFFVVCLWYKGLKQKGSQFFLRSTALEKELLGRSRVQAPGINARTTSTKASGWHTAINSH
jgi:5-methylcytosine-specific restriction enzyme A